MSYFLIYGCVPKGIRGYQYAISGLSVAYQWPISGLSVAYHWPISGRTRLEMFVGPVLPESGPGDTKTHFKMCAHIFAWVPGPPGPNVDDFRPAPKIMY